MPSSCSFIKMHGCGNDYVFVDCFTQPAVSDPAALAVQISDRHTSVGADGLVLMLPATNADADAEMRMFNSDGSEGAMCGNALRCFAMWLYQSGHGGKSCRIAMKDRIVKAVVLESDSERQTAVVRVDMGPPVPINTKSADTGNVVRLVQLADLPGVDGTVRLACVSMGNPHAVLFVPDLSQVEFRQTGPAIERHAEFPDRTNVEFVQPVAGSRARVRVWERGSGETLACGSGACAVAVAGIVSGVFQRDQPVILEMQGGTLQVCWPSSGGVQLQGPAVESFRGVLNRQVTGSGLLP